MLFLATLISTQLAQSTLAIGQVTPKGVIDATEATGAVRETSNPLAEASTPTEAAGAACAFGNDADLFATCDVRLMLQGGHADARVDVYGLNNHAISLAGDEFQFGLVHPTLEDIINVTDDQLMDHLVWTMTVRFPELITSDEIVLMDIEGPVEFHRWHLYFADHYFATDFDRDTFDYENDTYDAFFYYVREDEPGIFDFYDDLDEFYAGNVLASGSVGDSIVIDEDPQSNGDERSFTIVQSGGQPGLREAGGPTHLFTDAFDEMVMSFKDAIDGTRLLLPNAELAIWGQTGGLYQGPLVDAFERAFALGMFANIDVYMPVLYGHAGPTDFHEVEIGGTTYYAKVSYGITANGVAYDYYLVFWNDESVIAAGGVPDDPGESSAVVLDGEGYTISRWSDYFILTDADGAPYETSHSEIFMLQQTARRVHDTMASMAWLQTQIALPIVPVLNFEIANAHSVTAHKHDWIVPSMGRQIIDSIQEYDFVDTICYWWHSWQPEIATFWQEVMPVPAACGCGVSVCSDGLDNDNDGLIDADDLSCRLNADGAYGAYLDVETSQCSDGLDNEGSPDGVIDGEDPGCWTNRDDFTTYVPYRDNEAAATTACQDGIDNDWPEGLVDMDDPDCGSPQDNDESYYTSCADADMDNNGDVGVEDLVALLLDWGLDGDVQGDLNNDGIVNNWDVIVLILAWGPCPV